MPVAGGMIWGFSCSIIHVGGQSYLVTGERSYYPKEKVFLPVEVVEKLKEDPSRTVWCRLLGTNNKEVIELWDNRTK